MKFLKVFSSQKQCLNNGIKASSIKSILENRNYIFFAVLKKISSKYILFISMMLSIKKFIHNSKDEKSKNRFELDAI